MSEQVSAGWDAGCRALLRVGRLLACCRRRSHAAAVSNGQEHRQELLDVSGAASLPLLFLASPSGAIAQLEDANTAPFVLLAHISRLLLLQNPYHPDPTPHPAWLLVPSACRAQAAERPAASAPASTISLLTACTAIPAPSSPLQNPAREPEIFCTGRPALT